MPSKILLFSFKTLTFLFIFLSVHNFCFCHLLLLFGRKLGILRTDPLMFESHLAEFEMRIKRSSFQFQFLNFLSSCHLLSKNLNFRSTTKTILNFDVFNEFFSFRICLFKNLLTYTFTTMFAANTVNIGPLNNKSRFQGEKLIKIRLIFLSSFENTYI